MAILLRRGVFAGILSALGIDVDKDWQGHKIKNLGDPAEPKDAVTKQYVDDNFTPSSHQEETVPDSSPHGIQPVDPASTDTTKNKVLSNALAKEWEDHKNTTSGNPHGVDFIELDDTPSDYTGRGGEIVLVKATEDGLDTLPWPVTGVSLNYFLSDNSADIGGYYYMYPTETGDTSTQLTSPALGIGDDQLLWSFVTEAGEPGVDILALGAYTATLHLQKSGNKDARVYWKLFKRDAGGNETELLQSAVSDLLTSDSSQFIISAYLNEDQILDPTDRLVFRLYANVSGSGNDVTITLTMEGDYDSRVLINVLSSSFSLDRLSDVEVSSPADGELLVYDAGFGKWVNRPSSNGGMAEHGNELHDPDMLPLDASSPINAYMAGSKWLEVATSGIVGLPKQSGMMVWKATAQSISPQSVTKVELTDVQWDIQNEYDTTNSRFTASEGGKYLVIFSVRWETTQDQRGFSVRIHKNGSLVAIAKQSTSGSSELRHAVSKIFNLDAGDYLEFYVFQEASSSRNVSAGEASTWATIVKIA